MIITYYQHMLNQTITPLDYHELRSISGTAARCAILQILKSTGGNITHTALLLSTTRKTIYKAIDKKKQGNLSDTSTKPLTIHNKTSSSIEEQVVTLKKKTRYGPKRLVKELYEVYTVRLSLHTIRNILRRNKDKLKKNHKPKARKARPFIDWYSAKACEIVQIDLKHVIDQKALSDKQIDHIHHHNLPKYQWGALDVMSRFKLIAYSDEKSWTNGLMWFLWVTSYLRAHGITRHITYTVDHGEEFGGKSWMKMVELRKLLKSFNCSLIQNTKGHPEENAHLERSHRTDDDEFYIPRILSIKSRQEFFLEAFNYIYYYNCVREHSSLSKEYSTPYQTLIHHEPSVYDTIRYVPPLILDQIAVDLGSWSGYHVLAQHQNVVSR